MSSKKTETKTYLLELTGNRLRRVTVPDHWRLTFGPTTPYEKKENRGGYDVWALRFYDGKNLIAIFTDVKSFHDESIEIMERVTKVQRKATQRATPKGMKDVMVEARVTEWVKPGADDPEDGDNNPFLLEAAKDDNPF